MPLSIEEVRHIAGLARLNLSDKEEQILAHDMGQILNYVATLNDVDTSNVEPMTHVHNLAHVIREDIVDERLTHEDALSNAPESDGEYFRVPKVIG